MNLCRRTVRFIVSILILSPLLQGGSPRAIRLPVEPEEDNREFIIDLETNAYNRMWREIWDEGDNRIRFRMGSNNVRDWFIEEELKLSAQLLRGLRLRYWHGRLHRYSSDRSSFDIFEFEGNILRNVYFSWYAKPTFSKVENTMGFMMQHRKAVNHYFIFFVELPHFLTNFTESHSDPPGDIRSVFNTSPVRFGIDTRELLDHVVWLRLIASTTNTFKIRNDSVSTGRTQSIEAGKVSEIQGYVEYVFNKDSSLYEQSAVGIEGSVQRTERSRSGFQLFALLNPPFVEARYGHTRRCATAPSHVEAPLGSARRRASTFPLAGGYETDPFTPLEEDTVEAWFSQSRHMRPYAWIRLADRSVVWAALRYEKRQIEWRNALGRITSILNWYVVPSVGFRYSLGERKASIVEAGFLYQRRRRDESEQVGATLLSRIKKTIEDSRIVLTYEYHFAPDKAVRIVETIDLDRRDWGQFSIHDHGFIQMQFGF